MIVAVLASGTGVAQGAPVPKHLGETATAATSFGNCACTSVQFGDIGTANNSYTFPFSGVITKSGFYVGEEINAADWVQMRSFSRSGTNHATVTGDGAKHMLQGLPSKSVGTFYERLPVSALGALGARYSIASAFIEATPTYFNSPNTVDEVLGAPASLAVGDSFEATPSKKLRVNVEAVLEPDEDHDTYGDVSQDLCPASPIGGGPCSGALFGSDLQEAHSGGGGSIFEPLLVQKTVDGASTALPFDGVVVRWRVLFSHSDEFRVRVLSPQGSALKVLSSSAVESVSVEPSPPIGKVTSFATRLPIPAGSYVGLASPTKSLAPIALNVSGASATEYHDAADGSVISAPGTARAWEVAYDADIEPDADHDGFGDITQDSCPGAATVHDGQCPVIDDLPPAATPKITGLEVAPKKFRVKAKGTSAKLKLTLSREATVSFGIEAKKICGGKGKGRKARCKSGFRAVQTITQRLSGGQDAVPFSARLRSQAPLRPGSYRVTAVPTAGGVTGKAAQATFAVLQPRHRAGH
ncbi:MAG: hypothetical protein QOF13_914 [Solirubrobacterales bacterium]|nr:hypothetical protein [Solirubrobacterales bacterium]